MNVVSLSPHFPPNYYPFCARLKDRGVNVLGLADPPYETLRPELREALTEYYRVDDLHDYGQLLRACGYFTHRYGKIDRIESHSEYWLETEARLRTDFHVFGIQAGEIDEIKSKSRMKRKFVQAGAPGGPGGGGRGLAERRGGAAGSGGPGRGRHSRSKATGSYNASSRASPRGTSSWKNSSRGASSPSTGSRTGTATRCFSRPMPSARGSWRRSTRTITCTTIR